MSLLIAILAAALPTAIYSILLWWLDRYEKEPLALLMAAFLWGSMPAIALAVVFELILSAPLASSPLGPNMVAWGLAPVVEEPVKALALIGLFLFARQEFDGPLDGVIYGALVGFGFSMTENLLYFVNYAPDMVALFWVRSVLFGLNHAFFTSLVGLALGIVRYKQQRRMRALALGGGLLLAILFHALHNFVVRYQVLGIFCSWLILSSGVIVILAILVLAWRHERQWMEQELGEEVLAGVLTRDDYDEIMSSMLRTRRQAYALLTGGWSHYRKVARLHQLVTELAFCKSQLRLADRYRTCAERDDLREEIIMLREALNQEASRGFPSPNEL